MNFKFILLNLFIFSLSVNAFEVGTGSQFIMTLQNQKVDLEIYVAKSDVKSVSIEMHMGTKGIISSNLWQQFEFKNYGQGPISIEAGYILLDSTDKPEVLSAEFYHQNKGLQVQDFLFAKNSNIEGDLIGKEMVELTAGDLYATHYRKKRDGQIIDFWISDKVKPIGLVKLVSQSTKDKSNNYELELSSLIKNVKPSIDSSVAIPMTKKTKSTFIKNFKK